MIYKKLKLKLHIWNQYNMDVANWNSYMTSVIIRNISHQYLELIEWWLLEKNWGRVVQCFTPDTQESGKAAITGPVLCPVYQGILAPVMN